MFQVQQRGIPRYALGVQLAGAKGSLVRLPVGNLAAEAWHHIVISYDLLPPGRLWLLVDGQGVTAPLGLPATAPQPNPGYEIIFGGLSGLPGDNVMDLRLRLGRNCAAGGDRW